ncbi:MAG: RNA polymerase sigma factor RpoH [Aestuariibacter sp.]
MSNLSTHTMSTELALSNGYPSYLNYVRSIPRLDAEQERNLFERFKQENDLDAVREIILSHLRFVVHIAKGYKNYGLPMEDLVQEGNIGLMKSIKKFDLSHGVRLASFAVYWIKAEINEFVIRNWRLVKVATTKARKKLFFNLREMKRKQSWLTHQETEEIARKLGVDSADVAAVETTMSLHDGHFDSTFGDNIDDDSDFNQIGAYALEDKSTAPDLLNSEDQQTALNRQALSSALKTLDERSRDIVESRWLLPEEAQATLEDLAQKYGISAERVRQIEKVALQKIRQALPVELLAA